MSLIKTITIEDEEVWKKLKMLAVKQNRSISSIINELIKIYVEDWEGEE